MWPRSNPFEGHIGVNVVELEVEVNRLRPKTILNIKRRFGATSWTSTRSTPLAEAATEISSEVKGTERLSAGGMCRQGNPESP